MIWKLQLSVVHIYPTTALVCGLVAMDRGVNLSLGWLYHIES